MVLLAAAAHGQEVKAPPVAKQPAPVFVEPTVLGLAVWQWLGLLVLLLLSLLVGFIVRWLMTVALRARYHLPGLEFSQSSKRGTRKAVALLVAAGIWIVGLPTLELPPHPLKSVETIVQLVATVAAIWLLASLWDGGCDLLLHRAQTMDQRTERLLVPVTRKFVTAMILIGGSLAVLAVLGVNVLGIIAGLGIGGLAVALAAKDSVENLFGSLTILFDMPFALGDWVKIDKVEGIVEQINLRSTKIRTFEDSVITLPNSNLIKASVENFGARRYRRQKFMLKFAHGAAPERVEEFCVRLKEAIQSQAGIVGEKTIVELNEVTEGWIGVLVIGFLDVAAALDELKVRSRLMAEALRIAQGLGLTMAATPTYPPPSEPGAPAPADNALPKVE